MEYLIRGKYDYRFAGRIRAAEPVGEPLPAVGDENTEPPQRSEQGSAAAVQAS